jgi:hypothetical protein
MNGSAPDVGELKSDIERTRAELADTVDALAAKLDVKAQARHRAHDAATRASQAVERVRAATPQPVQHALDAVGHASKPLVERAARNKKRTALIVGGVLAAVVVARRVSG